MGTGVSPDRIATRNFGIQLLVHRRWKKTLESPLSFRLFAACISGSAATEELLFRGARATYSLSLDT